MSRGIQSSDLAHRGSCSSVVRIPDQRYIREVVGSIFTCNSDIFKVVPSPVAQQPSFASFIYGCIQRVEELIYYASCKL